MDSPEQMSADSEEILYDAVHRCGALQMGGRLETAHLPFALSGQWMRDLRSIILVMLGAVHHGRHHGTVRRRVAAQLVCDQSSRLVALSF